MNYNKKNFESRESIDRASDNMEKSLGHHFRIDSSYFELTGMPAQRKDSIKGTSTVETIDLVLDLLESFKSDSFRSNASINLIAHKERQDAIALTSIETKSPHLTIQQHKDNSDVCNKRRKVTFAADCEERSISLKSPDAVPPFYWPADKSTKAPKKQQRRLSNPNQP